jgi:hypothetical protein
MVAMPYILVDIVLGIVSLIFFCVTSAALLSRYPAANFYLPQRLRNRKAIAFVAQALVIAALSSIALLVVARLSGMRLSSPYLSDALFCIGLANAVILAYAFMDRRYFLNTPTLPRRLLIGTFSVVVAFVPALAVVIAVVGLFVIR